MTQYTDPKFNGRDTVSLRVFKRDGTELPFETPFRNLAEVVAVLRTHRDASDTDSFVGSLIRAIGRIAGPSPKQAAWAHKVAVDLITPRQQRQLDVELLPVLQMLQRAADAQKRLPRIVLTRDDVTVQLTMAGDKSRQPGTVNVMTPGAYGENTWFGRIDLDGRFNPSRSCTPLVEQLLRDLAADPAKVAGQHGVATGSCCFCRRDLSDKRSRTVGYGPDCAVKYGLPWGDTSAADAADKAAREAL